MAGKDRPPPPPGPKFPLEPWLKGTGKGGKGK